MSVLRKPGAVWRDVRVERLGSPLLLAITLLAAAASVVAPSALWAATDAKWQAVGVLAAFGAGVFAMLLILSVIEMVGIRFLGKRRGWRTTPGAAWVVIAHSAVGWLLGGVLAGVGVVLFFAFLFSSREAFGVRLHELGALLSLAAPAAGLLIFETLVWLGWRALRYANPPRAPRPLPGDNAPPTAGGAP